MLKVDRERDGNRLRRPYRKAHRPPDRHSRRTVWRLFYLESARPFDWWTYSAGVL